MSAELLDQQTIVFLGKGKTWRMTIPLDFSNGEEESEPDGNQERAVSQEDDLPKPA